MQANKSLAQMDLSEAIRDRRVQIGLIVVAVIAILATVITLIVQNARNTAVTAPGAQSNVSANPMGPGAMDPMGPGAAGDPTMRGMGAGGLDPGGAMFGSGGGFGGAGGGTGGAVASIEAIKKAPSPGVPTRDNPFKENSDLLAVVRSVPQRDPDLAPAHALYNEVMPIRATVNEQGDPLEGPPIPAMRVTGIIEGQQIAAMLQIGGAYITAVPGQEIPKDNPTYRVEAVEKDRVTLTRRWAFGDRKGTQRIEVPLAADPSQQAAFGGGFPGGAGQPGGPGGSGGSGGAGGPRPGGGVPAGG